MGPSHITVPILRHFAFKRRYTSRRPYLFSSTLRKEYAKDPDQLQDPLAFEPYKNDQGNDDHDTQGHKVTTGPNEFGHVLEVHAIYARNEGQRQEEGREYRQQFHDIVASLRIHGMIGAKQISGVFQDLVVFQHEPDEPIPDILEG